MQTNSSHIDTCTYTHILHYYVHRGASLDALDADLYTPLLTAAVYGQERAFKCLMKAGAPIDVVDRNRKSCVFLAAEDNHVGILKVSKMSPCNTSELSD